MFGRVSTGWRGLAAATLLTGALFGVAACGDDDDDSAATEPRPTNTLSSGGAGETPTVRATASDDEDGEGGESLTLTTPDDNRFDKAELKAAANTNITVEYRNDSAIPHNVHFFDGKDATAASLGATDVITGPGKEDSVTFKTGGPGRYFFHCDVHPAQMTGVLVVQ